MGKTVPPIYRLGNQGKEGFVAASKGQGLDLTPQELHNHYIIYCTCLYDLLNGAKKLQNSMPGNYCSMHICMYIHKHTQNTTPNIKCL